MWRSGRRSPRRCACLPSLLRRPFVLPPVILCRSRHRHAPLVPPPDESCVRVFFSVSLPRFSPVGGLEGHSTRCTGRWPAQAGAHFNQGRCRAWPGLLRRCPRHAVPTSPRGTQVLEYPLLVSSTGPFREVLAYFPQFLQEVLKTKQAAWYARFQITDKSVGGLPCELAMRRSGAEETFPLLDSTSAWTRAQVRSCRKLASVRDDYIAQAAPRSTRRYFRCH